MTFKELKQGYPVYMLNVATKEMTVGTVVKIGERHVTKDPSRLQSMQFTWVVDATINFNGQTANFEFDENFTNTTTRDGTTVITPNKDDIINAVRNLKSQIDETIKMLPKLKEDSKKCEALLNDLDPIYQNNQAQEARIGELQEIIRKQNDEIAANRNDTAELKQMVSQLIQQLK